MTDNVRQLYEALQASCQMYLPQQACERIEKAYHFAAEAHQGQKRYSGEPYIIHPLSVAYSMAKLYMDEITLTGALLHDVAEDTQVTLDTIEEHFGSQSRHLVDGVTHLKDVSQLEDMAHLFVAMASDVRVVLIKLFDRLHNMQTLNFLPVEKQRSKAQETLRLYVPLASKFGIWQLKTELETHVLHYIDPLSYTAICDDLHANQSEHLPHLLQLAKELRAILDRYGIAAETYVHQRPPYRVYELMKQQEQLPNNLHQMLRIVLKIDDVANCYQALGYIHQHYAHMSNRLFDFIGNPRDIFYRSLHTTILVPRYSPVDLRIRTNEFDQLAQIGVVRQLQFVPPHEQKQPKQATFLPELRALVGEVNEPQRFAESVFQDILQKHITCFTPRGKEISLPRGATILDFAYRVHTDIGHECRGAVVNGKQTDLHYHLSDGDHIEIIRARRAEPHLEWLDEILGYATTTHTRRKVREYFRRREPEQSRRLGRETLHKLRRTFNVMHVTAQTLAEAFQLESSQTLYLHIGNGTITVSEVVLKLLESVPDLFLESERQYVDLIDSQGQHGRLVGIDGRVMKLASCCNPKIGDQIVGYITGSKDTPIKIHRTHCRYVLSSPYPEYFARLDWIEADEQLYVLYLMLEGYDRGGLLRDMAAPIAGAGANMAQVDSHSAEKNVLIRLKLELSSVEQFIYITHRLETLQNITLVRRLTPTEAQSWKSTVP